MKKLNEKQCNRLSVIQKKAIRIIHGARYNAHTNELFQKSKITKSENIFESQSLVLTYQYQQRKLPEAILKLYDNSLYNRNLMTRYLNNCDLKPKNEIKKGQLMFDILNVWNNTNNSITGEQNLNAFKRKILEEQNKFSKCEKTNCYSCK